ncbi:threonyl-tRNA synthetase [Peptoniphilus koenoeneniae]|uniref:Threonine--tRNA ligase n=1 Tax=Peptoniphilus koenoeneniae TaxID=507751 RepID=A0ABU0AUC8_9FIRM|nr:threonine--tRNA ligase [Peptoniphilus koenoeneniae]MDQ0274861.1 threonyl-tRNA synthetase [Peptoniphilus koenoeneniae]
MKIYLPDNSELEFDGPVKVMDIAGKISEGLKRNALGAVVNGEILGMGELVEKDAHVKIVTFDDIEGKKIFWHTSSHLMAYAIKELWPETKFAIGPAIDNGFYYDIDLEERITPEDLQKIEEKMAEIVKKAYDVEASKMKRQEAIEYFEKEGQDYKVELIKDLDDEEVYIYKIGDFVDLCKGPHIENIKSIKAIKLLSVAGAYWRGDSDNKMLQRIYGISFMKKKQLDEYLQRIEEAEKRDHRKIGKELDLFIMRDEGPGFPFFLPHGMILKNNLLNWWRNILLERGYGEIQTPIILNEALWHRSGHWDHYKDNMYFTKIDNEDYAVKPMNCPGSILVYEENTHSYRDLPIRLSEFGQVHRHELSGALHGLFRVRTFTQDDAHVYCLPSQVKDEVFKMIDLADLLYSTFGFKYKIELSTRPDDFMGKIEDWNIAEKNLKDALEEKGLKYEINEGDGAFYGPKIDFHLEDAIGRTWQCGTIQLDFQMPQNFELSYINENGEKARPVMLHRALLGSIERFMGILIEHFAGKFPLWLSPVQIQIIPVSEKFYEYAEDLRKKFKEKGFRVEIDERAEKVGYKIRQAQLKKINYMLVVGEQEMESGLLSVRKRNGQEIKDVKFDDFVRDLQEEVDSKRIED